MDTCARPVLYETGITFLPRDKIAETFGVVLEANDEWQPTELGSVLRQGDIAHATIS